MGCPEIEKELTEYNDALGDLLKKAYALHKSIYEKVSVEKRKYLIETLLRYDIDHYYDYKYIDDIIGEFRYVIKSFASD